MNTYIHQLPEWPRFQWDPERLAGSLASVRHRQGRLIGKMDALGFSVRQEAVLWTLTSDVVRSGEIEGEKLDAEAVRSSLARKGKLTKKKWAAMAKCSHDTAPRDIQDLLARGILAQNPGGGRRASHSLGELG